MNIAVGEVQAWLEPTKAYLGTDLDAQLEESIATQVFARVNLRYDSSTWTTPDNTPKLIRKILAMKYASWYYQRQYSEDSDTANDYALLLNAQAETLLAGVLDGSLELEEVEGTGYPTGSGTYEELPPPAFTMGRVF